MKEEIKYSHKNIIDLDESSSVSPDQEKYKVNIQQDRFINLNALEKFSTNKSI
jgi:hypothetical protein